MSRLLLVFAHPDDESFFTAGTVARHVAAGGRARLLCATKGEHGSQPVPPVCPPSRLGRVRAAELRKAGRIMGVESVSFLGYEDGKLAGADFEEAVARIAREIRAFSPEAVVTFGPGGLYGHPDHVAISRMATEAFDRAGPLAAARARLWYVALSSAFWRYRPHDWVAAAGPGDRVDDEADSGRRLPVAEGAPEAAIDILPVLETKMEALLAHRTQRHNVERALGRLYDFEDRKLAGPEAAAVLGREHFTLARGPRPAAILVDSLLGP